MVQFNNFAELLAYRATQQGSDVAYVFLQDGETIEVTLTYEQLYHEALTIARHLKSCTQKGDRVLLFYPSGLEFIKAFFACMYAGVIAVPSYPPRMNKTLDRLTGIIEDCNAVCILTDSTVSGLDKVELIAKLKLSVIYTDQISAHKGQELFDSSLDFLTSESIAFLQYTSGSTGMPKGVKVSHKNILSNQALIKDAFNQARESVIVGWLPFYHDMGLIGNILHPVYLGAKAVLMSPTHFLMKPSRWLAAISKYKGTTSGAPNFAYELCCNRIGEEDKKKFDLSSWKVAFCGAEPIRPSTVQRFIDDFGSCRFHAPSFQPCYGMAETTLLISAHQNQTPVKLKEFKPSSLTYGDSDEMLFETPSGLVSCGRAQGFNVKIVGPDFLERKDGHVGEIWVQGDSVSKGYWNKVELNKECFEAVLDGQKYFRTGDLGIIDHGELYIAGRLKDLIILNGRNLYPHDIEHLVTQSDDSLVSGACAAFSLDKEKENDIIVVCEVDERKQPNYDRVSKSIRLKLSDALELDVYDIVFIKRNSLPKTTSGKIQRYACRNNYIDKTLNVIFASVPLETKSVAVVKFENEIEEKIFSIVEKITGYKSIALDDNFFSIGMDSLKVTALAMELNNEFAIDFEVVFEHPNIKTLASRINSVSHSFNPVSVTYVKDPNQQLYDLSTTQHGIWLDCKVNPKTTAYNIFSSLHLPAPIEEKIIEAAFHRLLNKHSVLRTCFVEIEGKAYQKIIDSSSFKFEIAEFEPTEASTYSLYVDAFKTFVFHLSDPFLFRVALVKTPKGNSEILFLAHHIISDGSSIKALFEEWLSICNTGETDSSLNPQFVDYSNLMNEKIAGDAGIAAMNYWREELKNAPSSIDLPFTNTLPEGHRKCQSANVMLDKQLLEKLERISKKNGVSLFATLLSSFVLLLNRLSGEKDIVVGTPFSLRDSTDALRIQGPLVNAVFLRNELDTQASFNTWLKQVHDKIIRSSKYKFYPVSRIIEDLNLSVVPGKFPIAQVFFNFLNFISDEREFDTFQNNEGLDLNFYINCYAAKLDDGIKLRIDYREALFERETILDLLDKYHAILSIVGDHDEVLLKEIKYNTFTPPIVNAVDSAWYTSEKKLRDVLYESLTFHKNGIAISTEQHQLTYADIDRITDDLHRKLISKYKDKGHAVILTAPNHNLPLSIISCIKAGWVYACLDWQTPSQALKSTLLEVSPCVIITDQQSRLLLEKHTWLKDYEIVHIENLSIEQPVIATNQNSNTRGDDLLYLLYTSGTTGIAKGVMQTGRNLLHYMSSYSSFIKISSGDRISGLSAPSYDSFNKEFFGALLNGASYHPCSVQTLSDPIQMLEWLEKNEITIWQITPILFRYYTNHWQQHELKLKTVRVVKMTGDSVRSGDFELFKKITLSHAVFVVSLGSTESSLNTIHSFTHRDSVAKGIVPVGFPINRTEVLLIDEDENEVDVLEKGELIISSEYLSPGYYCNPELTSLKFFSKKGKKYFRSGDIGRRLTNGKIEWLARNENNAKIRGIRVSLKELDYHICQYSGIGDSYSIIKEELEESIIVSYVVSSTDLDVSLLRQSLKKVLPEYNVSSYFIRVNEIPLNSHGKVNRLALPDYSIDHNKEEKIILPENSIEAELVFIWRDILRQDLISVEHDFFAVGGNSLKAMQLMSKVHEHFHVRYPIDRFFQHATIRLLADELNLIIQRSSLDQAANLEEITI